MIGGFKDKRTASVFRGILPKGFPSEIARSAARKLVYLDEASSLDDLRVPPANRLEALKGNRAGQHSMRINAQWRICFVWRNGHAYDVEIVDYH